MMLAAGVGRRMLPLTLTLPKPAVPVLGHPLAVQILGRLAECGVTEAVVNVHHLPDVLVRLLDSRIDRLPHIRISHEERILGTAGGLRRAAPLLVGNDPIVVTNSDFLADIDVRAVLATHRGAGAAATLVLAPPAPGYSVVEVDARGAVLSLAGEPPVERDRVAGEYLFTGFQVVGTEVLDRIPPEGPSDIVRDVYRALAAEGRVASHVHDGFWWEFGSPALYLEGTRLLLDLPLERRVRVAAHDRVRRLGDAVAAVGPGAHLDDGAAFRGHVALGFACRVGSGCRIEDSVMMPETWIGPGSRLRRSVVARGLELPAGFEAEGSLICRDPGAAAEIPPATRRESGLLIHPLDESPV